MPLGWSKKKCKFLVCMQIFAGFMFLTWWGFSSPSSYSQNQQDIWVLQLAFLQNWTTGFFLDIGAFNGKFCSNSYLLEKLGWNGVCVEPFPANFGGRRCAVVTRAVSDADDQQVAFSGSGQVRSLEPQGKSFSTQATTISFNTLLRRYASGHDFIHFVSLDVEGHELQALSTFPFATVQVGAWIVEIGTGSWGATDKFNNISDLMAHNGYMYVPVAFHGVDAYYVNQRLYDPRLMLKAPSGVHPYCW